MRKPTSHPTSARAKSLRYVRPIAFAGLLCLAGTSTSFAACTNTLPGGGPGEYVFQSTSITIDPTLPIGDTLHSSTVPLNALGPYSTNCTFAIGVMDYVGFPGTPTGDVYPSGIAGVGYRMRYTTTPQWMPWSHDYGAVTRIGTDERTSIIFELVKTGDITGAGSMTGLIGRAHIRDHNFSTWNIVISGSVTVTPMQPTCSVQTPNVPLDLGVVDSNIFTGIGTESALGPASTIQIACSGGLGGTVGVNMVLTDPADPSNRSDLLPTANGVGVRLRRQGDVVIAYGPDTTDPSATNRFFIQDMGNGVLDVPIRGQMVQTAPVVIGGRVQAAATFTLSYD